MSPRRQPYNASGIRLVFFVILLSISNFLQAENQLRFAVRAPGIIDVHLTNSDTIAALQLFVHVEGSGTIVGADFIDRTNGSDWQLPFNVTGTRDIRILLISSNSATLLPGNGSVVRIRIEQELPSPSDITTLSFEKAILASSDARALDVKTEALTFEPVRDLQLAHISNYPNPFNPTTTISFRLDRAGEIDLAVYDLRGRRIAVLKRGFAEAGEYDVLWSGTNDAGIHVATGLYFCRLVHDGGVISKKMILAR